MSAQIISGVEIAKAIREELTVEVAELKEKHGLVPGLTVISESFAMITGEEDVSLFEKFIVPQETIDLPNIPVHIGNFPVVPIRPRSVGIIVVNKRKELLFLVVSQPSQEPVRYLLSRALDLR